MIGREGWRREGKGREWKGREGKSREGRGRQGKVNDVRYVLKRGEGTNMNGNRGERMCESVRERTGNKMNKGEKNEL